MLCAMTCTDPFQEVSAWDPEMARQWADALSVRAAHPEQTLLRGELVAAAALRPGDTVLEVGCGTGVLLAELARLVGPAGRALGVEPQPVFAGLARQRLAEAGVGGWAQVLNQPGDHLPLDDGAARASVVQTVLVHVPKAESLLAEMCRVVGPGGRVASIDQDGDTTVIDHPDKDLTRRLVRHSCDARFADGWTGRRLGRLFRAAGLTDVRMSVRVHTDVEPGSFLHGMALRLAASAMEAGAISQAEGEGWLGELEVLAQAGSFFSSVNYYLCTGTKP